MQRRGEDGRTADSGNIRVAARARPREAGPQRCGGLAGDTATGPRGAGSARLEETQDRRAADYPVCRNAAAPGTGPHPTLARGTREPEAARHGLRPVSAPTPTPRSGRAARLRAAWTAPHAVAAAILCLR